MIDLLNNGLAYLPLKLTRNPLWVHVDAPDISVLPNRSGILLKCEVLAPKSQGSPIFVAVGYRIGSERPLADFSGLPFYYGQDFDISSILDGLLSFRMAKMTDYTVFQSSQQTIPFKTRTITLDENGVEISGTETISNIQYAFRGGITQDSFAGWGNYLFDTYFKQKQPYLSWQKLEKTITKNQPEYVSILVNYVPKPTCLQVRCLIHFRGNFPKQMFSVLNLKITNPTNYSIYNFPVGFQALNLDASEDINIGKVIDSYEIWISDENNQRLTLVKTFILNRQFMPYMRFILFENSLGGIDTIAFSGEMQAKIKTITEIGERQLPSNYLPSSAELFVSGKTAVRELTANTGWIDELGTEYLQELLLSENVYFTTQDGFIPVIIRDAEYQSFIEEESLPGRQFIFELAKTERAYSELPIAPVIPGRITKWIPLNAYCIYNTETGLATGYQAAAQLELRWADTNEKVKGVAPKGNISGTDGYFEPVISAACNLGTAPFKNIEIQRVGTFRRNNCTAGYGDFANVIVAANVFGGQTQSEANQRAEDRWVILNTQVYANQYAICVPSPEFYTLNPPPITGRFNFRFQSNPENSATYIHGGPASNGNDNTALGYGNHWALQGNTNPSSIIYPTGQNDCSLPCSIPAPRYYISFAGYNNSRRMRLWINGNTLIDDVTITAAQFQANGGGFIYQIPAGLVIPSQAFMFCLIENI